MAYNYLRHINFNEPESYILSYPNSIIICFSDLFLSYPFFIKNS